MSNSKKTEWLESKPLPLSLLNMFEYGTKASLMIDKGKTIYFPKSSVCQRQSNNPDGTFFLKFPSNTFYGVSDEEVKDSRTSYKANLAIEKINEVYK